MRHLKQGRKLNRSSEHRNAMFSNMLESFFRYERIQTTDAKAKELRRMSEKLITRAKEDSLHNKRIVLRKLHDRDVVAKLFEDIAPKYRNIHGGYTRILKLGRRKGDGAELSLIELIDVEEIGKKKEKAKGGAGAASKKAPKPKGEAPARDKVKADTAKSEPAAKAEPSAKTVKKEAPKAEGAKSEATKAGSKGAARPGTKTAKKTQAQKKETKTQEAGSAASKSKEKAKPAGDKPATAKSSTTKGSSAKKTAGTSVKAKSTKSPASDSGTKSSKPSSE
jgi:large subunit ribosomal protein L17